MTTSTGTPESTNNALRRETRASAMLVLVVLAVLLSTSFVGLAIS